MEKSLIISGNDIQIGRIAITTKQEEDNSKLTKNHVF